jgi:hypothetical protein
MIQHGRFLPFPVIAMSTATKQSSFVSQPWIASRSLSSGAHSRDPFARNEVCCSAQFLSASWIGAFNSG